MWINRCKKCICRVSLLPFLWSSVSVSSIFINYNNLPLVFICTHDTRQLSKNILWSWEFLLLQLFLLLQSLVIYFLFFYLFLLQTVWIVMVKANKTQWEEKVAERQNIIKRISVLGRVYFKCLEKQKQIKCKGIVNGSCAHFKLKKNEYGFNSRVVF